MPRDLLADFEPEKRVDLLEGFLPLPTEEPPPLLGGPGDIQLTQPERRHPMYPFAGVEAPGEYGAPDILEKIPGVRPAKEAIQEVLIGDPEHLPSRYGAWEEVKAAAKNRGALIPTKETWTHKEAKERAKRKGMPGDSFDQAVQTLERRGDVFEIALLATALVMAGVQAARPFGGVRGVMRNLLNKALYRTTEIEKEAKSIADRLRMVGLTKQNLRNINEGKGSAWEREAFEEFQELGKKRTDIQSELRNIWKWFQREAPTAKPSAKAPEPILGLAEPQPKLPPGQGFVLGERPPTEPILRKGPPPKGLKPRLRKMWPEGVEKKYLPGPQARLAPPAVTYGPEGEFITKPGPPREAPRDVLEGMEVPEKVVPRPEVVAKPTPPPTNIIPYSKDLKIKNIDVLPRGLGTRYLEVIEGEKGAYVAKQWRRKPIEKGILIDFEATKPKPPTPPQTQTPHPSPSHKR